MIHDKQTEITWHVDDLKVSHSDKDIFESFIEWNKDTYDDVTRIKPLRGNMHDYLAMTLVIQHH